MQNYHPMMVEVATGLVRKWQRLNHTQPIDVSHDMTSLTLETIGLCGFDYGNSRRSRRSASERRDGRHRLLVLQRQAA